MDWHPVTREEALTVRCPKCGALNGQPCTRLADQMRPRRVTGWHEPRVYLHRKGDPMDSVHPARPEVVRAMRRWYQARDLRPVVPASRNAREAAAALRAFDLAEYERLRDWLRDWGWLLTEANLPHRPDGTLRGAPYWGQD